MSKTMQLRFDDAVDACEESLAKMQAYIMKKQWEKYAVAEQGFTLFMHGLQTLCKTDGDELTRLAGCENRLRELSRRQRRVMRLLASHMQAVSDDITSLEQDSRRLRQLSEFAGS